MTMGNEKDIGMGEYGIGNGEDILKALGIGSCVAVCMYTENGEAAGMAHVMLPEEEGDKSNKHADILVPKLIDKLEQNPEINKFSLKAKIFGGASMFEDSTLDIGAKNIDSVKKILDEQSIDIVEEDTGGNKGRAIWLNTRSGDVVVRKSGEETRRY